MICRIGMLTRRPDLSPQAFRRHWRDVHGPLAARMPGLRRYVQNAVVDSSQLAIDHARGDFAIDGFSQLWFDDLAAMQAASFAPAFAPTLPDLPRFCAAVQVVACEPNIVVPVADGPLVKRMSILTRRPGLSPGRFRDEWFGFHAEAVRKFPGLMGYTQNLVVDRPALPDGVPATADGIVELWFRSVEDIRAAFASSAAEISQRHALDFIGTITTYLVEPLEVAPAG
jgi:uncharacterized protein (TIGR02118 family)